MLTQTNDRETGPLGAILERFFQTKTSRDVDGTMSYFAPDLATYTDATLGWNLDGFDALRSVFEQYMPGWVPPARSYATRIRSNEISALIHMVDTPELFGGELRILAAVDVRDGKIVRWVDYWDGSAFDADLYQQLRTPDDQFPRDLKDTVIPTQAASELVTVTAALHDACTNADSSAAAALLHTDVVVRDMSLRTQIIGRIESERYLDRVLGDVPYGQSSSLRHVVGAALGGGFEWTAGPQHNQLPGITAIELNTEGLITELTSVYDSRQLSPALRSMLAGASLAP
jgi:hypothetical protein